MIFVMLIKNSILVSSTKTNASCTLFSYTHGKTQIHISLLPNHHIVWYAILPNCFSLTCWALRNATAIVASNDQTNSQNHAQFFRSKALLQWFWLIWKHVFTKIYRYYTPMEEVFTFLFFLAEGRIVVMWHIAPVEGTKCKAAELILLLECLHLFLHWIWL